MEGFLLTVRTGIWEGHGCWPRPVTGRGTRHRPYLWSHRCSLCHSPECYHRCQCHLLLLDNGWVSYVQSLIFQKIHRSCQDIMPLGLPVLVSEDLDTFPSKMISLTRESTTALQWQPQVPLVPGQFSMLCTRERPPKTELSSRGHILCSTGFPH